MTREVLPLTALLSRPLLAIATVFERDWDRPVILPHYPMLTHRCGYPDGS